MTQGFLGHNIRQQFRLVGEWVVLVLLFSQIGEHIKQIIIVIQLMLSYIRWIKSGGLIYNIVPVQQYCALKIFFSFFLFFLAIRKVDLTLNVTTIKIKQKLNTRRRRRQLLEVMAMLPLWLWLLLQVYMYIRLTDLCALNTYSLLWINYTTTRASLMAQQQRICLHCRRCRFTPWSGRPAGGGDGNPL